MNGCLAADTPIQVEGDDTRYRSSLGGCRKSTAHQEAIYSDNWPLKTHVNVPEGCVSLEMNPVHKIQNAFGTSGLRMF